MPEHFSAKLLREATEALGSILQWIAELIAAKNWFNLLVLSAIALFFLGKPPGFLTEQAGFGLQLLERLGIEVSAIYPVIFGVVELALLTSALAIAVRAIPKETRVSPREAIERKAIKGLRPFNREDAEVFTQLQRERSLQECIESITTATFRFGILMGESGCGKTSFLQAGVWPQLTHETSAYWGVYVRFSERDPIQTIAKALAEQLKAPIEDILPQQKNRGDLVAVLTRAVAAADRPLVLLLDQFEQFFVHAPRAADQEPFVQALADWYRSPDPLPVKILVSIRSDLLYQLSRLHQALGYALGPQEVFVLEKFTPTEAAKILAVIAKSERLEFESKFVEELAEDALANREDGLISPVDLQILAWMIERQREDELRAFSRVAFQKFGGVEGLLTRFLERTLSARVVPGQRQAAMKTLLALTDLDRQVRAGVMTLPEIQAKLKATAKPAEVAEAVAWLVRGDVRLITPQEREGETGYELAHERLIPALIRQAGKELSAADKANQLLDWRVNEWLGNDCDRRWLLNIQELYLIGRQRPYLVWGAKQRQKERLLRLSRQRVYRTVLALAVITGVLSGAGSWLSFTPQGQIMQIEWQLANSVPKAHASIMADAAVAFAKDEQWPKSQQVIERINQKYAKDEGSGENRDRNLVKFIHKTADFLPKLDNKNKALSIVQDELIPIVKNIQADNYKSQALRSIASAAGELNEPTSAAEILQDALKAAQTIQVDYYKSQALRTTAYNALQSLR
ncbi:MAG: NACHT domain-containing protein, partial [Leptolyngbyaceae cyanobacterium MO_188.B28]|nr:NACHT domain-containing protein [Leptolyngbyaceae cyanobacterium MO_188.B28]